MNKTKHQFTTMESVINDMLLWFPEDQKTVLRSVDDCSKLNDMHMSLGAIVRNRYGLWQNNEELLMACGKAHPDDASMVIIEMLWRKLRFH